MSTPSNFLPPRRMILATHGLVRQFREHLPMLTPDVDVVYHDVMRVVIESMRSRLGARRSIEQMVGSFEDALRQMDSFHGRTLLVEALEDLAFGIYSQVIEYGLYNKDGMLMYTYYPHPDAEVDEVYLHPIIQLTYNPNVPCYEPRLY